MVRLPLTLLTVGLLAAGAMSFPSLMRQHWRHRYWNSSTYGDRREAMLRLKDDPSFATREVFIQAFVFSWETGIWEDRETIMRWFSLFISNGVPGRSKGSLAIKDSDGDPYALHLETEVSPKGAVTSCRGEVYRHARLMFSSASYWSDP